MIDYQHVNWQIFLVFRLNGSVFPRALMSAAPGALVSIVLPFVFRHFYGEIPRPENPSTLVSLFAALTSVLGFLIVFRTHSAYGRYWEGITLLRTARGEWFNAYSSLLSFCSADPDRFKQVESFQHQLARFMSILNCVALQTITDEFDPQFPTLDTRGLNSSALKFLASKRDPNQRMEILIQWIQKIIVEAAEKGTITVAPPILSRSFQEVSRGSVALTRARDMTEIPFPFPYVQLVTTILMIHGCLTPILMQVVLDSQAACAIVTFLSAFVFWGMNDIAAEIESPFGNDANDLPLYRLQEDFNASLWALLERRSQAPATFSFTEDRDRYFRVRSETLAVVNDGTDVDSGEKWASEQDPESKSGLAQTFFKKVSSRSSWRAEKKKKPFTLARSHVRPALRSTRTDRFVNDGEGDGGSKNDADVHEPSSEVSDEVEAASAELLAVKRSFDSRSTVGAAECRSEDDAIDVEASPSGPSPPSIKSIRPGAACRSKACFRPHVSDGTRPLTTGNPQSVALTRVQVASSAHVPASEISVEASAEPAAAPSAASSAQPASCVAPVGAG